MKTNVRTVMTTVAITVKTTDAVFVGKIKGAVVTLNTKHGRTGIGDD